MMMQQRGNNSWDAWLSKAIPRVVILSLLLRLTLLIRTSSKSTGQWLDDVSTPPDFPTIESWEVVVTGHGIMYNQTDNITRVVEAGQDGDIPTNLSIDSENNNVTQGFSSYKDVHAPSRVHRIPLEELINSQPNVTCNPGKSKKRLIYSTPLPPDSVHSSRKIPKMVHVTSKTRCMTPPFLMNLDKWRFPGYGFYFHDEAAMDRLLAKYWPEFPQLQWLQHCMISGAAKADLWRLLVLWEYGGIYTDIDNAPALGFKNGAEIQDDDEAWFVVENLGILSQWFMAAEPGHPLIYISILILLERLLEVQNIQKQFVPFVTGPGTLKLSMMRFRKVEEEKVKAGKYTGVGNKTVTVVGRKGHAKEYIIRGSVSGIHKKGGYVAMGMLHFSSKDKSAPSDSCYEYLHSVAKESLRQH